MKNKSLIATFAGLLAGLLTAGCSSTRNGGPDLAYSNEAFAKRVVVKFNAMELEAILNPATPEARNKTLEELKYLIDANFLKFESALTTEKAYFETVADLSLLGLGAAGTLGTGEATKAILAAISAGVAGTRISINKNFFMEQSMQVVRAKMKAARERKGEQMRRAMTLSLGEYPIARGLSDLAEYYRTGTLIGAFDDLAADAGLEKKTAEAKSEALLDAQYDESSKTRPLRDKINKWLDANPQENVKTLNEWIKKQKLPQRMSGVTWVEDTKTTKSSLESAIKEFKIE